MRRLAISIFVLCGLAAPALGDTIRIIIPFTPGGALDPTARLLASGLAKLRPGDNIVIENIGGGGGVLGLNTVAKAAPDGRTLLFSPSGAIVISPFLQTNQPYDGPTAFEPVALIGSVKTAMIVRPGLNVKSLAELVALAKSGAKLNYASPGVGTSPHISGEMLNLAAGIKITHVPYRGLGPAFNDMLGGHMDVITTSVIGVLPYVQAKTALALAVFDTERSAQMPDVPTTVELGYPDLVMPQWYGLLAPTGLPRDVRDTLEAQVLAVLRSPDVAPRLAVAGMANPKGAREFKALLDVEFKKWPVLLPKLGIQPQ